MTCRPRRRAADDVSASSGFILLVRCSLYFAPAHTHTVAVEMLRSAVDAVARHLADGTFAQLPGEVGVWVSSRSAETLQKQATLAGRYIPEPMLHALDTQLDLLTTGRWLHTHQLPVPRRHWSRNYLFAEMAAKLVQRHVLYLEFGVWRGDCMRQWTKLLPGPHCRFHGFDSFEGLPEDWQPQTRRGHFDQGGQIPVIDDPRVKFFKGWFQDTLPNYQPPQHEVLVVICDADLYSSTQVVLKHIRSYLKPGSLLYFDEFSDRRHELKAFDEFLQETPMSFAVVGATRALRHIAFERIA